MKLTRLSFMFVFSLLIGHGSLVVNTASGGADEYALAGLTHLNFNDTLDSLFIHTPGSSYSYGIFNIESIEISGALSVSDIRQLTSFRLMQNYPNPFNPVTTIQFEINERGKTRVDIFNLKGQLVNTLINKHLNVGKHRIKWDGKTAGGSYAGSGLYLYRVVINDKQQTRQMIMLK